MIQSHNLLVTYFTASQINKFYLQNRKYQHFDVSKSNTVQKPTSVLNINL